MHPRTVRQDGETLLELIRQAAALPAQEWPAALPEPLPLEAASVLKKLRAVGQRTANELDIAPEIMLRKKILEALLKSGYPNGPTVSPSRCAVGAASAWGRHCSTYWKNRHHETHLLHL
ncbi:Ribonuclease D [Stutzerimonas stutzeri]